MYNTVCIEFNFSLNFTLVFISNLLMWLSKRFHFSPNSSKNSSNFPILSFKDIEILYNDDDDDDIQFQKSEPVSNPNPKSVPSILQRTRSSINNHRRHSSGHRNAAGGNSKGLVDSIIGGGGFEKNFGHNSTPKASSRGLCKGVQDPEPDRLTQHSHAQDCTSEGVVFYFTSLRVVRRTFQDCWTVRSILRGYRIPMDERDLSMDSKFVYELQEIMVSINNKVSLPAVFIAGKYIGGTEEITRLHESGELKKVIGAASSWPRGGGTTVDCDLCGGLRFVVCEECDGSHKIYFQKLGFRSCMACNVDGLVRCPSCFTLRLSCR